MKRIIVYNFYLAGLLLSGFCVNAISKPKPKTFERHLLILLLFFSFSVYANAQENKWYLVTDTEQYIEMSRVWSLVATDTEDTFSILDFQGNILAEDVLKATFSLLDPTGIKEIKVQGNELSSLVNNVLTLIGVEGNVEIFSVNGVKMVSVKATKQETRIDVSHFTTGVYVVKCGNQSFKFTKK